MENQFNENMKSCKHCGAPMAKTAKTCPTCGGKNKKPIYKRVWFIVLVVLVVLGIIGSVLGPKVESISAVYTGNTIEKSTVTIDDFTVTAKYDDGSTEEVTGAKLDKDITLVYGKTYKAVITYDNAETTVEIKCDTHKPTKAQENAYKSAKNYISSMPFSRNGLIEQLSSSYGDGYSHKDAVWAVNQLEKKKEVNWKHQAYLSAKNYLSNMSFSKDGLIEQLESSYGEGFTHEQAVYGANKAYNE